MHVNAENLLVESVGGELVVTDLKNLAMPLIRYRTRDAGVLLDRPCACGRGLPLLELRGGRTTDFLRGDAGQRVSGIVLATYAITNLDGVGQIQFVQDDPHRVTIRVVRCDGWSDTSAAALVGRVREFLGATMQTRLEYVDAIPLEASGKYRFSISTLPA
jgi:phenylacetate-CoA ligase